MQLQGILFDVDGTLVDSNDIHARCWLEAFDHFGKKLDLDTVRHQIGKGGDLLVPDLLNAREMRKFGENLEGVPFRSPASSANRDEVQYYTDLLGAGDLIEGATSKGDVEFSKPSPEIFEAGLDRLGTDPARTLVAGDTPYDILAAHRAALPIAAVLCGGFERELLEKAEFLLADVRELVREIDRIDEYFTD